MSLSVGIAACAASLACAPDDPARAPGPPKSASAHDDQHDPDDPHDDHDDHEARVVELTAAAVAELNLQRATVERRRLVSELRTTGQVDFDQSRLAHVSPRAAGRVHSVRAVLGERVRGGATLAEIDSIELGQAKSAYLQTRARDELARTHLERARGLFANEIVAEARVLEAAVEAREADASLRAAEETLRLLGMASGDIERLAAGDRRASLYSLRAPIAGTVVERHATLGELVTPERNLFTLADLGRVWIWIDIYQRDLANVHLGDGARARVDAFPDRVFAGTVSYLSAQVDVDTRTVRARIDVANPDGLLRPGMFVDVELDDPHHEDGRLVGTTLAVPESAVIRDGDDWLTFVAHDGLRFEARPIRVGRRAGGFVEVLGGLDEGETIVVEGAFILRSAASEDALGGGHSH